MCHFDVLMCHFDRHPRDREIATDASQKANATAFRQWRSLVAGGGFVPESLIDSVQLADSTMVRNAKKGHKGNSFIQFSFRFLLSSFQMSCARDALLGGSLESLEISGSGAEP